MKTYSRKKFGELGQEVIADVEELCRLCMGKEEELISIYNNDELVPLTLKIMACVALEVFEGDGLPEKICHPCKFQLEKSYHFRKKCEQSDTKLRQHLRELREKFGHIETVNIVSGDNETQETEMEVDITRDEGAHAAKGEKNSAVSTEEDLLGITKVTYIERDPEPEDIPNSITLPSEADLENREACTLKGSEIKADIASEDESESNVFIIEEPDPTMDDASIDAIAGAVKATLASQPGLNLSGQLQLTVNQPNGKSTQVEVTTEDGDVIVMEILSEDQNETSEPQTPVIEDTGEDGELKVFKCPECPKSFSRRIQLSRHASVHMQQKGFSCGICEKWFPTRSALIRHERIHTGERPFQCEVCTKSFAQKEILFRHLMTHTGQRPYACPHCPKGYSQKEQLRVHMKAHLVNSPSDIQLHYCSLCPKVFCHASGLSRHLVTHTGKTFKCRECDKTFTDKSSLRRHLLQSGHQS